VPKGIAALYSCREQRTEGATAYPAMGRSASRGGAPVSSCLEAWPARSVRATRVDVVENMFRAGARADGRGARTLAAKRQVPHPRAIQRALGDQRGGSDRAQSGRSPCSRVRAVLEGIRSACLRQLIRRRQMIRRRWIADVFRLRAGNERPGCSVAPARRSRLGLNQKIPTCSERGEAPERPQAPRDLRLRRTEISDEGLKTWWSHAATT